MTSKDVTSNTSRGLLWKEIGPERGKVRRLTGDIHGGPDEEGLQRGWRWSSVDAWTREVEERLPVLDAQRGPYKG